MSLARLHESNMFRLRLKCCSLETVCSSEMHISQNWNETDLNLWQSRQQSPCNKLTQLLYLAEHCGTRFRLQKQYTQINVKNYRKMRANNIDHNKIELIALIPAGQIAYALSAFRCVSLIQFAFSLVWIGLLSLMLPLSSFVCVEKQKQCLCVCASCVCGWFRGGQQIIHKFLIDNE